MVKSALSRSQTRIADIMPSSDSRKPIGESGLRGLLSAGRLLKTNRAARHWRRAALLLWMSSTASASWHGSPAAASCVCASFCCVSTSVLLQLGRWVSVGPQSYLSRRECVASRGVHLAVRSTQRGPNRLAFDFPAAHICSIAGPHPGITGD